MKSQIEDRDTVGTTYLKAQKNSVSGLTVQDIGDELAKSLVEDLNDTIESNPFCGKSFFINVVEERDLQMPNAIKRRMFKTRYRPFPEDNTLVFYVEPKSSRFFYCWDIPHHSEMVNTLSDFRRYHQEYIQRIREWMVNDLSNFGFIKVSMSSPQVEGYKQKTINIYKTLYLEFLDANGIDKKTIEAEKRLGFFWVPSKFHEDELCGEEKTSSILAV